MTLDGKIAASDGSSKWVTEVSRAHVQELRRQYSGILVGIARFGMTAVNVSH